jgi:hypothetical protein
MSVRTPKKLAKVARPKSDDFKSVAKRLECDEDKAASEKKLGKIARGTLGKRKK